MAFLIYIFLVTHLNEKVFGDFRFANNYGSNMVLQRAPMNAVLWGFGEDGQKVQIRVNNSDRVYETTVQKGW